MVELFGEYKGIIVFLHVISAVIWVGGMVAIRFAAHPSFMQIESPAHRLERISHTLKRLFSIVTPFVFILLITAVIMLVGYDMKHTPYAGVAHAKEAIWAFMSVNLFVMILRRNRAVRLLEKGDMAGAKFSLELIGKYMVPLNIILGVVAIYLGATLSTSL